MLQKKMLSPFNVAVTAVFTAFVYVATIMFSIYVPATEGFFNIGESMVFLSALLFGPFVGAFAGGIGSMLADLSLGYSHYAPGTLVIKACEGFVVGMLKRNNPKFSSRIHWKYFTLLLGVIVGSLLTSVGVIYYSGQIELTLGTLGFSFLLPTQFWVILGALVTLSIAAVGFVAEPEFGWTVFSVMLGGFTMVLGYFIYEMFLIGPLFNVQAVAVAEIPINVGQMAVGATVALPVAKIVWRMFPYLKQSAK